MKKLYYLIVSNLTNGLYRLEETYAPWPYEMSSTYINLYVLNVYCETAGSQTLKVGERDFKNVGSGDSISVICADKVR